MSKAKAKELKHPYILLLRSQIVVEIGFYIWAWSSRRWILVVRNVVVNHAGMWSHQTWKCGSSLVYLRHDLSTMALWLHVSINYIRYLVAVVFAGLSPQMVNYSTGTHNLPVCVYYCMYLHTLAHLHTACPNMVINSTNFRVAAGEQGQQHQWYMPECRRQCMLDYRHR